MARRRSEISDLEQSEAITLVPSDDPAAGAPADDAAQQWTEFEAFRDAGEGGTAGMHVSVYRIPTDVSGNPISSVESALLFTAPIDVYTLPQIYDRVKKEYMPRGIGRALIRIQVRREKVRGVLWQKMIPIEKGLRDDEALGTATVSGDSNAALTAIAQMVDRQSQLLARLFESRQNIPVAPPIDPMQQTERMIAMITGLAGILVNKNAAAIPAGSIGDQISGFRELLKLTQELGGGKVADNDSDNSLPKMLEIGKPYVELLGKMIERTPATPRPGVRRVQAAIAAPRPTPAPQASGTAPATARPVPVNGPEIVPTIIRGSGGSGTNDPTQGNDPMLLQLAKHVSDICTLREQGQGDPAGIAKMILDAVPEQYDEKFYSIVADESWLIKLASLDKRVSQHAEFFSEIRTLILAEFAEEPEAEASSAPTGV